LVERTKNLRCSTARKLGERHMDPRLSGVTEPGSVRQVGDQLWFAFAHLAVDEARQDVLVTDDDRDLMVAEAERFERRPRLKMAGVR